MLMNLLRGIHKHQNGISRISVAGITIAALAVAGLLVYTSFGPEDSSVTVYSTDNSNALELRGSVIAMCDMDDPDEVDEIVFTVTLPENGVPVNFTAPPNNVVEISYIDENQEVYDLPWTSKEYVYKDGDAMLEQGETFLIASPVGEALSVGLGADTTFNIEVKTPDGEILTIKRTIPEQIHAVMNLE